MGGDIVLWTYGPAVAKGSDGNFVPLDRADDWLHLILGVGMIGLGLLVGRGAIGGARTAAR